VPVLETAEIQNYVAKGKMAAGMPRAQAALDSLLKRKCPGADMLGWLDLPRTPESDRIKIEDAAKRIQDENDCLVVVGIGGSYLGARAAIEALPEYAAFPVLFAGQNLSAEYHDRLISSLADKRFALCVISKSGTTTEPAIAFRLLRKLLIERYGKSAAAHRTIAVTDPRKGALRGMAEREGFTSFEIPPDVGGRFSVLSPVGLLPCAAAGIAIGDMLDGAASALSHYTRNEPGNDALRYALIRTLLHEGGTAIEVLSTFHPELAQFCEWWKQLAGESEGKNGGGLFPASAVMTTDLHSLGQLLQEGTRNLVETFLVSEQPRRSVIVPADVDDPDGLNYLAGKDLAGINRTAFEATRSAHCAGGIPVLTIGFRTIDAPTLGSLFFFFEVAIAVSGLLLGVNPFDQPGVERYKTKMFAMLGKPGVS
jgi:glucose-6-phosphate isomerase